MRLTREARARAIGQIEAGRQLKDVAAAMGVSKSTITRLRQRYVQTGSVEDRPRTGQPRVTSQRTDRVIRLTHLRRRFQAATETANATPGRNRPRISPQTVRRRLREAGIRCRRPYYGARLTRGHRVRRRNWAAAHARWRRNDWQNVLFTDETKVMVDSSDKRQNVYRRPGERFSDACVKEVDRWGRASTMIWAGISHMGKTDIVFLDNGVGRGGRRRARGGLTAQRYVAEVLRPVAVPYIRRNPNMVLQQDNARPHTARFTVDFLRRSNVQTLQNWPALSADLNPIEHCWDYLKRRIRKLQLDTVAQLRAALRREWRRVPMRYIQRLIRSMRARCQAVVAANGGHTRY